jgi:hypothetical protein
MLLKQINWFALVGGILILLLLFVSFYFPWWQLVIGDNLFKVNVSPVNTNVSFLGSPFSMPLIWAVNFASVLTFLASGIIMVIYAVKPAKTYSKELLGFGYRKPLYAVIASVAGLLIVIYALQAAFGISIPLMGSGTIVLPPSLTPMGINVSVIGLAGFQWPFLLAIVAAGLCIAARVYHRKLSSPPKQILQTTANASQITPTI